MLNKFILSLILLLPPLVCLAQFSGGGINGLPRNADFDTLTVQGEDVLTASAGTADFVNVTGDTMTGDLNIADSEISVSNGVIRFTNTNATSIINDSSNGLGILSTAGSMIIQSVAPNGVISINSTGGAGFVSATDRLTLRSNNSDVVLDSVTDSMSISAATDVQITGESARIQTDTGDLELFATNDGDLSLSGESVFITSLSGGTTMTGSGNFNIAPSGRLRLTSAGAVNAGVFLSASDDSQFTLGGISKRYDFIGGNSSTYANTVGNYLGTFSSQYRVTSPNMVFDSSNNVNFSVSDTTTFNSDSILMQGNTDFLSDYPSQVFNSDDVAVNSDIVGINSSDFSIDSELISINADDFNFADGSVNMTHDSSSSTDFFTLTSPNINIDTTIGNVNIDSENFVRVSSGETTINTGSVLEMQDDNTTLSAQGTLNLITPNFRINNERVPTKYAYGYITSTGTIDTGVRSSQGIASVGKTLTGRYVLNFDNNFFSETPHCYATGTGSVRVSVQSLAGCGEDSCEMQTRANNTVADRAFFVTCSGF